MKYLIYLLFVLFLPLTLVNAQDDHSHDSDTETHEHSSTDHSDEHNDHNDDKEDHDHGEYDSSHADMAINSAANTVMLGELAVKVEPLIMLDGTFILGLRPETTMMGELELMAETPSGEMVMNAESSTELALLELGQAETGVYRISGSYDGNNFSFPVSIYQQSSDNVEAYLILAPSPSLENRGMSEAFAYATKDGETVHSDFVVKRSMAGMQHSTDNDQLTLSHTHFDDVYDDKLGETPMANQTPLGFSMVGTWQVELMLVKDEMQRFIFTVEMLGE